MSFQKLQCIVGPMLNSVFQNSNIHLSKIFYFNISESLSINTVKQIFHFYFHVLYLLGLLFKRASLCNWQHLDLQILYRFSSDLSKKSPHTTLICFHYFCISLAQSKHSNIKIAFFSWMLSRRYSTLNWQN